MSYNEIFEIGKLKLSTDRESKNYYTSKSIVKELTPSSFNPFITYHLKLKKSDAPQYTFVMFYAPWCGYCKRTKELWTECAKQAKLQKLKIKVKSFNCEKNKDYLLLMNEEYKRKSHKKFVPSYPTLILYKDEVPVKVFTGERTLSNLMSFIGKSLN